MNYLIFNVYKHQKYVNAFNINKDGLFLDAILKPKTSLKLKNLNKSSIYFDISKNIVNKITNINAVKRTFIQRKSNFYSFLNLTAVKNKTETSDLRQLSKTKMISAVELSNKNSDIILANSKIEIRSSIKTGVVGDSYIGNGSFTLELQKGIVYQFSFPPGFLNNLTNFDFITKISTETIKIVPNRYGVFTLYCDGGIITLKVAPGLIKN